MEGTIEAGDTFTLARVAFILQLIGNTDLIKSDVVRQDAHVSGFNLICIRDKRAPW